MSNANPITDKPEQSPAQKKREERKRYVRGLILGSLALIAIPALAWLQVQHFGTDSFIFISLFNFNLAVLLLILFVVIRNGVKLLLERRNKVLGTHLRTRLVVAFMGLTLVPCVLMFLVSTKFVQISVDFWFQERVDNSIDSALEVGQGMFVKVGERLREVGKQIVGQLPAETALSEGQPDNPSAIQSREDYLNRQREVFQLAFLAVISPGKEIVNWSGPDALREVCKEGLSSFSAGALEDRGFHSLLIGGPQMDFSLGIMALGNEFAKPGDDTVNPPSGYLVLAENMGPGVKTKLERIASGVEEYKRLKKHKLPLKWMLYISLGVLSMSIVLGAMWLAFKIAKSLTAPVQLLVEGTERIARGDLAVRLDQESEDELGQLVSSFNRMATDLEASQSQLTAKALELTQHNVYIEKVLDNIGSGVISLDAEGRIATANKAALSIINMPQDQLTGKFIEDFLPDEEARETRAMREYLSRREGNWRRQATLHIGGQERRLLLSAVSLVGPAGEHSGIVAVFEDIAELERMQRMEAWREVAKRVAHEIKNPLTPIKLSAERLNRKFGPQIQDPAFVQCTDLIVRQVENMQSMVQEFSAFAKMPEVTPRAGNILPIIEDVLALFRNSHSRINFKAELPLELPQMPVDPDSLQRAFINILTNAVEALEKTPNPTIELNWQLNQPKGFLRLDFMDNGPGLALGEQTRLFEPYFSRKKGGSGLGLTIVRSVVNDHRGYVNAHLREEGGLIIRVELPLV